MESALASIGQLQECLHTPKVVADTPVTDDRTAAATHEKAAGETSGQASAVATCSEEDTAGGSQSCGDHTCHCDQTSSTGHRCHGNEACETKTPATCKHDTPSLKHSAKVCQAYDKLHSAVSKVITDTALQDTVIPQELSTGLHQLHDLLYGESKTDSKPS